MTVMEKSPKQRLRACERVLLEHMEEFVSVGMALKEIRDDRLYEADGITSWGAYMVSAVHRFGIKRRYADELISSAELRMALPDIPGASSAGSANQSGWSELAVRPLKKLKTTGQAKTVAAKIIKAVKDNGEKVTSTLVGKFVNAELDIRPKKTKNRKATAPTYNRLIEKYTDSLKDMADMLGKLTDAECRQWGEAEPGLTLDLVRQIERVQKVLEKVWHRLPD